MMWIAVAVVALLLLGLAWWTSGRAKPGRDLQRGIDIGGAAGRSQAQIRRNEANGPRSL